MFALKNMGRKKRTEKRVMVALHLASKVARCQLQQLTVAILVYVVV